MSDDDFVKGPDGKLTMTICGRRRDRCSTPGCGKSAMLTCQYVLTTAATGTGMCNVPLCRSCGVRQESPQAIIDPTNDQRLVYCQPHDRLTNGQRRGMP